MSNGVGVLPSISASLPPIAPSVAPDSDDDLRPAGRGSDAAPVRKGAPRGASAPPAPRVDVDPAPVRGIRLKPSPAGAVMRAAAAQPPVKPAGLTSDALRRVAD